jgi:hypothetical protein
MVLGRHDEPGGNWRGRLVATVDGAAVLRQTHSAAALLLGSRPDGEPPPRALATRLLIGPALRDGSPAAATEVADLDHAGVHRTGVDERDTGYPDPASLGPVACPLAGGGLLLTAIGADLLDAERRLALVQPATGPGASCH